MDTWAVTAAARSSLLDTFDQLDDDQWEVNSLCSGWTVREVLAHLILAAKPPLRRYAVTSIRERSGFDRANHVLAVADATHPVDELIARYRALVDHRFSPPGWPQAAPLADILLHTMDVEIPLGVDRSDRPEPPEHFEPVLELLLGRFGRGFTEGGRPSVRWVAIDHDWSHGDGPSVHGTMADLALTAAGRGAVVDRLDGDGADIVREWLA